jgi:Secretion system C-terminal sorting domain
MRYKKLLLCSIFLAGLGLSGLTAQEVIPATGGNASGSGGSVSYSVGQIFYTTNTGTNGTATQGVQQAYEISVITALEEAKNISLGLLVYPNPATDFIRLKIENHEVENLKYQLFDINGSLLQNNKIEGQETNISMQNLSPSTYFLKVTANNIELKTFKIIKK